MKTFVSLLNLTLLLFLISSCDFNDSPESTEATVNFRLVDAPAAYDEIWVEVLAIRVKADNPESEMDEDDSTWEEIIYDGSKMVNLLDLTGGNSILLGTEDFHEGEIDQIRLILGENNYLMKGDNKIELTTPSAQQSGLKIKIDQQIEGGKTYDLVIDFDAAKSIVTAGNSGKVILKPVLRAYIEESQGIKGQVFPLEAQPVQVLVTGNGAEVGTFADEAGNYSIMGLASGTYSVTFTPKDGYMPKSIDNLLVQDDKITIPPVVQLDPQ